MLKLTCRPNECALEIPMPFETILVDVRHETITRTALPAPWLGMQAWSVRNQVGESPVWDDDSQRLLWIDVRAPAVLRLEPASGALTRWMLPDVVGALGLAGGSRVVLALRRRLGLLDLDSGELRLLPAVQQEPAHNRLNEGKVSPGGRWFVFGSMDDSAGPKQPTGALYRADAPMARWWTGPAAIFPPAFPLAASTGSARPASGSTSWPCRSGRRPCPAWAAPAVRACSSPRWFARPGPRPASSTAR
jgi:hypothetical protein